MSLEGGALRSTLSIQSCACAALCCAEAVALGLDFEAGMQQADPRYVKMQASAQVGGVLECFGMSKEERGCVSGPALREDAGVGAGRHVGLAGGASGWPEGLAPCCQLL